MPTVKAYRKFSTRTSEALTHSTKTAKTTDSSFHESDGVKILQIIRSKNVRGSHDSAARSTSPVAPFAPLHQSWHPGHSDSKLHSGKRT